MRNELTQKQAREQIKANGCTLRRDSSGDFVIRCGRTGETYYTDCLHDAVATAAARHRLAKFVAEHDGCKVIGRQGLSLIVSSEAVREGKVVFVIESIPNTLNAVRDWLGY